MMNLLLIAATLTVNSVSQNAASRIVTVNYTLANGPAVVTMGSVTTNGAAMAAESLYNVSGEANKFVTDGTYSLTWLPPAEAGFGPFDAANVEVSLKAWATNAPPDYMVIDLEQPSRIRYYQFAGEIPGGVTDDRYKTDYLVMRRIPAAGVEWRMGSTTSVRPGSWGSYRNEEHTHYVKLTEDYYLGVYPVTFRHFYWLNNQSAGTDAFASFGGDWSWPMGRQQFVVLRSWFHNSADCSYLKGLADPYADDAYHKFWPRDGHEIDANNTPKCACKSGGKYTPTLRKARDRYGVMFDLPTDAQWEFACRAEEGASLYNGQELGPIDRLDDNLDEIAWYVFNSSNATYNCCLPHPVGLKKPNAYGLYDMIGNISEFCLDIYEHAPNDNVVHEDPKGKVPAVNIANSCVIRGGTFDGTASFSRSPARQQIPITYADNSVFTGDKKGSAAAHSNGFRLWAPCHAVR